LAPLSTTGAAHKDTLVSFWSSVMLGAGTYRGNPMAAHRPHPIRSAHFDHWLALWSQTARALLAPDHAALFKDRAERIARSLRHGLGLDDSIAAMRLDVIERKRDG
jgi:hemoglobin